jgi:acetylornithine deacetylase/succinyl-diaminopimelate desuccinylase-like protein
MSTTDIDNAAARYTDAVVELIERFIEVPTENPPGVHYADFLPLLKSELDNLDISYEVAPIPGGDGTRWAVIAETGSGDTAFQFHGHYDVVPAFSREQFKPVRRNGELWGRGSTDMKGGLAGLILAAAAVRDSGLGRVRLMIVPDEETGGELGAGWMRRAGLITAPDVRGVIVGEPTGDMVWHACLGAISMKVTVRGKASHVGLHYNGMNAFEGMTDIVTGLRELGREVSDRITELGISPDEAQASILLLGGESTGALISTWCPRCLRSRSTGATTRRRTATRFSARWSRCSKR